MGARGWAAEEWNLVCADGEFGISFHPSGFADGYAQLAVNAGRPKDLPLLPLLYRHLAARRAEREAERE
jgi:hypothetical protein